MAEIMEEKNVQTPAETAAPAEAAAQAPAKKPEKSPDALCIRALFFLRRGGRVWAMAFRNCRRAASPSVKSLWGGGPGEDLFEERSSPGIHARS